MLFSHLFHTLHLFVAVFFFFALCLYVPLLTSFGTENTRLQLGAAAAAPAAGCDAHAALCCRLAVAVGELHPLAV